MPTKSLSEKLLAVLASWTAAKGVTVDEGATLREAARVLSALESAGPEVAELEERAARLERAGKLAWPEDLRAWIACIVARQEARAKLAALVEGLREVVIDLRDQFEVGDPEDAALPWAADKLDALLATHGFGEAQDAQEGPCGAAGGATGSEAGKGSLGA